MVTAHGSDIRRVDALGGPWALHDTAASRQAEQAALALHPPHALMQRAGTAVARLALALVPHAQRVEVWAGPGNNGGDGLVAARLLQAAGKQVRVVLLGDAGRLPSDAAAALADARAAGVPLAFGMPDTLPRADLFIDALLGLGVTRAPAGTLAAAIAGINAATAPVLAVDLPSGLMADTGAPPGPAVQATATLSLLTLKAGCFTAEGRDHAGAVWLADLGVTAGPPTAWLSGPPPLRALPHASHKGRRGDVAVVGGAEGMLGAAWLAARAASAAGAGRVYCSLLDDSAMLLDPQHPELMGRRHWWQSAPRVLAATTVVCGCGGGTAVAAVLPRLLSRAARLVLDADGLNAVASDSALRTLLCRRHALGLPTLLTPHPLEAARLLDIDSAEVQRDRLAAAQALAAAFRCAVLLKGSGSVVAEPAQQPWINPTGSAALAVAGTGDVLAGWVAGLWAQSPASGPAAIAVQAAWQHGHAADSWPAAAQGAPLRASDLVESLARPQIGALMR